MTNPSASPRWTSKGGLAVALAATASFLAFEPWQWWGQDPAGRGSAVTSGAQVAVPATSGDYARSDLDVQEAAMLAARSDAYRTGKASRQSRDASGAGRSVADIAAITLEPTGAILESVTSGAARPQANAAAQPDAPSAKAAEQAQPCCPPSASQPLNGLFPPFAMMVAACAATQQLVQPVQ